MQKIKVLVEVFNGYYEQRDVKVAVAKNDFDAALKAAKLLPAGTKYEEEKKEELIRLIGGITCVPVDETAPKTDTPTDPHNEPISDNENHQDPVDVILELDKDNENPQNTEDETTETIEPEAVQVTDPVEQIVEASEIAENVEPITEPESVPAEEVSEDTAAPAKKRRR